MYADGVNQAARRKPGSEQNWIAADWGWAWPANRRILYNRASADPDGKPWSERKALVWWDAEQGTWTGHDVPDFVPDKAPDYEPPDDATGPAALSGRDPFIMQSDGKAWLYAPAGLLDGPLPAHYEPQESPVSNALYAQQRNPVRQVKAFAHPDNRFEPSGGAPGSEVFPYVATTYRLTEHHTAGGMSRWLPYLSELQPEFFCEVSPELAAERGLDHLGWATIITARNVVEARVLVTERMRSLTVQGRRLHQVGLPYHWGSNGYSTGDSANDLVEISLDPNTHIQETKAFACDIRPGRRPTGPAGLRWSASTGSGPGSPSRRERSGDGGRRADRRAARRDGKLPGRAAADGLLHRHLGVHRLQGLRGGVQGVEQRARGRAGPHRHVVRQLGRAERGHLAARGVHRAAAAGGRPGRRRAGSADSTGADSGLRWLMSSDVCKHCTHAACLDVCPTGALMRTEFGTVVVQSDVCNGCGYCIPACPYGVIDRRKEDGRAWKCTLCYDRLEAGMEPACAKACPTDSIQFGPLDELRERAGARLERLHEAGEAGARLYGNDPGDGVGGDGAFFLLLDEPEVYGLPPDPVVTTRDLPSMWRHAGAAAATLAGLAAASFAASALGGRLGLGGRR